MTPTINAEAETETKKNTRPLTRRGQIEFILKKLNRKQLDQFLIDSALNDNHVRDALLIQFGELLSEDDANEAKYRRTLNTMIERHIGADGIISRKSAQILHDSLEMLISNARKPTTPSSETVDLCLALMSVLPRLTQQMDDADGHVYRLMKLSCVQLWEVFKNLPPERQQSAFERLLREYVEPAYLEADLDSFILTLLRDWAKHQPQWQKLCLRQHELLLKAAGNDKWRKNYLLEQTQALLSAWKKPA